MTQALLDPVTTFTATDPLDSQHLIDFRSSLIDRDIIRLNFRSSNGTEIFDTLYPNPQRLNTGALNRWHLRLYNYWAENTGWICQGIDPLTMLPSAWGCVKPDSPRWDDAKQKPIKYEHPRDVATEVFCLRVTYAIGLKCAQKAGLIMEQSYLDRIGSIDDMTTEDTGFWQWVRDNPQVPISITEGAKKAAAMLSAGYITIGLPGIRGGYRTKINGVQSLPYLIPQLKVFAAENRPIAFVFDNDIKRATIKDVRSAIERTGRLLQRDGCKVSVVSWDVPVKGVDDLIVAIGEDGLDEVVAGQSPLDQWRIAGILSLSQYEDVTVTVDDRYVSNALSLLPDTTSKIIGIKSAKGTGKTDLMAAAVAPCIDRGQPILVITHRIQLAKALAERFGINHIEEVRSSATGGLFGYAMCVDSLHPKSQARFSPDAWVGATVIIDETEQVLWHLLNSPTCQSNRVAILDTFAQLMQVVANSGGTIYLADADLSRVSIEYIRKLTNNQMDLWLLINTHNPNLGKRKLYTHDSEALLIAEAYAAIERGDNIIIHCSSQKAKSKWSPQNLETALRKRYPDIDVLRIDRETVGEIGHPACGCIESINEIVVNYQVVLASPTIETGISIDGTHFDGVYAIANGVQTVDAFCQTIERVRADVPRHICISNKAIQRVGNGSTNIRSLLRSEHKTYEANHAILSLVDNIAEQDERDRIHLSTWGLFACKVNLGYMDYKASILGKLATEGYDIVNFVADITQPFVAAIVVEEAIVIARDDNYQTERDGKIAADNPTDTEYKKLQKQRSKTKEERHQEAKGKLCRRYMTEDITDEIILKDDAGWHPQLELHYYLTIGRQHLADRDRNKIEALAPGAKPFKVDANKVTLSSKIAVLDLLDVTQFFGVVRVFTNHALSDWHQKVLHYRGDIKDWLGINISAKSTPIQAAQQILGVLGLKLTYIDQVRADGKVTRRYAGAICNVDNRDDIFRRWSADCHTQPYRSIYSLSVTVLSVTVLSVTPTDQPATNPETPNQDREVGAAAYAVGDRVSDKKTERVGTVTAIRQMPTPNGSYYQYQIDFGYIGKLWREAYAIEPVAAQEVAA